MLCFSFVQVTKLCKTVGAITTHHHNMVYLVGLLPLVERGAYLRKVLSCVFIQQLLGCPSDDLPETKVNLMKANSMFMH
jgi:Coiled-coil and Nse Interacting (CANIN) domain